MSIAVTVAPARAARIATSPVPVARSSTRSPGAIASRLDELVVHRGEASGDPLVAPDAPDLAHRGHLQEHTSGVGDLFSEAAGRRLEASAPLAQRLRPDDARRLRRPGARRRAGPRAAARDRAGPRAVADPLRPAGLRQDDAGADRRAHDRRRVRGALGGVGDGRERARGARPGARAARRRAGGARSSSSTRSTASTRRSRTRCCPGVEEGLVTLIGATTENPYFEVNSALLSRAQVYELEPLGRDPARGRAPRRGRARRRGVARGRGADRQAAPAATPATR